MPGWLNKIRNRQRTAARQRSRSVRLRLEGLEERRLFSVGSLDPTFGTGGLVLTNANNSAVFSLALQPDGKILAGGDVNNNIGAWRYNSDGTLDTSFGANGFASSIPGGERALALQPDGKIVVLGDYDDPGTGQFFMKLVRFNSDGSLDTTFGNAGSAVFSIVGYGAAVAVQSDGKIVAVGQANLASTKIAVARYLPNGQLVPRSQKGAVLHDAKEAADRLVAFLGTGKMPVLGADPIALRAESVCVHGDSAEAVEMARHVRMRLEAEGVKVVSFLR